MLSRRETSPLASGSSNVYDSRLPFGIGSFAEGIPFEGAMAEVASQQPPSTHLQPTPELEVVAEPSVDPPRLSLRRPR